MDFAGGAKIYRADAGGAMSRTMQSPRSRRICPRSGTAMMQTRRAIPPKARSTVYAADSDDGDEIDSRFNLSGKRAASRMQYGSRAVDLSADENYEPTPQTGYSPSQWTPDYDDPQTTAPVKRSRYAKSINSARRKRKKKRPRPRSQRPKPTSPDKRTPIYSGF